MASEIEAGVVAVGKTVTDLKLNSRTPTQCVVIVTNTLLVTIAAGSKLLVTGVGKLP